MAGGAAGRHRLAAGSSGSRRPGPAARTWCVEYAEAASAAGWHGRVLAPLRAAGQPGAAERAGPRPADDRARRAAGIRPRRAGGLRRPTASRFDDELGVPPGAELPTRTTAGAAPGHPAGRARRRRRTAVQPAVAAAGPGRTAAEPPVPRQLPAAPGHFVGRAAELRAADRAAGQAAEPGPVVISRDRRAPPASARPRWRCAGRTRLAHRFPDGQLYVNLRGFDPPGRRCRPPRRSAGSWTRSGVPAERMPAGLDAQAALYRSLLAGQADAGGAGQRPRRRAGASAAARRARLPGAGDQPQPAHRPGRRPTARAR